MLYAPIALSFSRHSLVVVACSDAQQHPTDHSLGARAHNLWRSLLTAHYTPKGEFPVAASCGGMCTTDSTDQITAVGHIHKNNLPLVKTALTTNSSATSTLAPPAC